MTTKIISMEKRGKGWTFSVCGSKYRTDTNGDGIWHYGKTGSWFADGEPEMAWKQYTGLCQFSLPENRNAAYKKIRRYFGEEIERYELLRYHEGR